MLFSGSVEYVEHELRHHQDTVDEARVRDVEDASVDDGRGVENLVTRRQALLAKERFDRVGGHPFALLGADHQTEVTHDDNVERLQEGRGIRVDHQGAGDGAEAQGQGEPERHAGDAAEEHLAVEASQLHLGGDHPGREGEAEDQAFGRAESPGMQEVPHPRARQDKKHAYDHEAHQNPP